MFNSFLFIVPYVFFLQPSARQEVGPRWGTRGVFRVSTEELWGTLMRQDGDTFFCFSALTPERSFINDACRACNECNHSSSLASMHIWLIFQCCVVLDKCTNPGLSAPCFEFLLCERLCWKPIVSFSVVRNHVADKVPHKCLRLNMEDGDEPDNGKVLMKERGRNDPEASFSCRCSRNCLCLFCRWLTRPEHTLIYFFFFCDSTTCCSHYYFFQPPSPLSPPNVVHININSSEPARITLR